jgi:hypothetical protein
MCFGFSAEDEQLSVTIFATVTYLKPFGYLGFIYIFCTEVKVLKKERFAAKDINCSTIFYLVVFLTPPLLSFYCIKHQPCSDKHFCLSSEMPKVTSKFLAAQWE